MFHENIVFASHTNGSIRGIGFSSFLHWMRLRQRKRGEMRIPVVFMNLTVGTWSAGCFAHQHLFDSVTALNCEHFTFHLLRIPQKRLERKNNKKQLRSVHSSHRAPDTLHYCPIDAMHNNVERISGQVCVLKMFKSNCRHCVTGGMAVSSRQSGSHRSCPVNQFGHISLTTNSTMHSSNGRTFSWHIFAKRSLSLAGVRCQSSV